MYGKSMIKYALLAFCLALLAGCSSTTVDENAAAQQPVQTIAPPPPPAAPAAAPVPVVQDEVYYFDFDQDTLHAEDNDKINAQAIYLVAHPNAKIRLEGHTDQRGSREYNIALGWRRAKAVGRLLQLQGVAPNQIEMVSYGEEKPAAFGQDEDSYSKNRRVVLAYEVKE